MRIDKNNIVLALLAPVFFVSWAVVVYNFGYCRGFDRGWETGENYGWIEGFDCGFDFATSNETGFAFTVQPATSGIGWDSDVQ